MMTTKYGLYFNDGTEVFETDAENKKEAKKKFIDALYDMWNNYCESRDSKGNDITRDRSEPEKYSREKVKDAIDADYVIKKMK